MSDGSEGGEGRTIGGQQIRGKVDPKMLQDFKDQQARSNALQERYRQRPGAGDTNYIMLTPMAFMPPIMLTRLIKNVTIRERSFKGLIGTALCHSILCVAGFYDGDNKTQNM